jgi:sigma-B regulation protein RsbU (phosphoserine phosphatase)
MTRKAKNQQNVTTGNKDNNTRRGRVISIRLIVTAAAVVLIVAAVVGIAGVAERNTRSTLARELEKRLVLEARNLALLSSGALLSDYPELTLHPIVKEMTDERPELEIVYVVDHAGVVQGHADVEMLGTPRPADGSLTAVAPTTTLDEFESLSVNDDLLVVRRDILHPNGQTIGAAVVGLKRSHVEASLLAARRSQLIVLFPVLGAAVLLTMLLMSRLLRPISVLRGGIERIGRGELDARVELRSRTELDHLAQSINEMATALESAQVERIEKERLSHEMELARQIQRSLLPGDAVTSGAYTIAGAQEAAAEVGGDYYDVFAFGDGRLGVVVADVAGKGLAGCMVTSMIAVLIRTLQPYFNSPSQLLNRLDESLQGMLQPGTFVTMFYGILDTNDGKLTFASAAQNPLLHFKAGDASIEWRRTRGIPVGMARGDALASSLDDSTLDLSPGDVVLVFTDGFNEAVNDSMEEYGFDRVAEAVGSLATDGGKVVVDGLRAAVSSWEGGRAAEDDKTALVIERAARASAPTDGEGDGDRLTRLCSRRPTSRRLSLPARLDELDRVHDWLLGCDYLDRLSEADLTLVEHGVYEILCNIAEHGCGLNGRKTIDIWWIVDESGSGPEGYFLIRDRGAPPRPENWPSSEPETTADRRKGRGYGLQIIRETLAEVEFHTVPDEGNFTIARYPLGGRPVVDPATR